MLFKPFNSQGPLVSQRKFLKLAKNYVAFQLVTEQSIVVSEYLAFWWDSEESLVREKTPWDDSRTNSSTFLDLSETLE